MFKELYNWALKRHRNKRKKWVNNKYWHKINNRQWVFEENQIRLKMFTDTPIVRHYWLNTDKNPYTDEKYFKTIKDKQKKNKLEKRKQTAAFNLQNITN